ncbi:MAG: putative Type pilus pilin [Parcubacteria group bacterium]|nr:putative Type pilus pilin [Parcubacteria group bacterium]
MESTVVLTAPAETSAPRGFTLVEMLVVLAIIAIITAVAVTGQSAFNRTLLLTDTTYGVAFSARQAQSFGISSRKFGSVQNAGYGLHFSSVTPTTYTLFADTFAASGGASVMPTGCPAATAPANRPQEQKPGDCRFEGTDGTVSAYTFGRGFVIKRFCGKVGATNYCSDGSPSLSSLDAVFTRPNTSTTLSGLVNGSSLTTFTCAEVTVGDGTGQASKTIRISSLGEISIGQTCP